MMNWIKLAILFVLIASSAFAGWTANGWRLNNKYQKDLIEAQQAARTIEQDWNIKLNEARNEQTKRETKLRADADSARSAADRLRITISKMPVCSGDTGNNTNAIGSVLNSCVERYGRVAADADRCYSEKQTLIDAWPK